MLLILFIFLISQVCLAAYNSNSRDNVVAYWGQADNQERLSSYCQKGNMDVAVIGFLNYVTPTHVEGNFGNACAGSNQYCSQIEEDIIACQKLGIKVLLSIGGGNNVTFSPGTSDEGKQAAETIYNTFNPDGSSKIKPFGKAEIDGFDIDLEYWGPSCGNKIASNHDGRISMYSNLRTFWTSKKLLLSAAPQCAFPDAQVQDLILSEEANVDIVLLQFYSTRDCFIGNTNGFESAFSQWESFFQNQLKGRNALLYPTIQGYNSTAYSSEYAYYSPLETVYSRLSARRNLSFIGGFGLWDVTGASQHEDTLPGENIKVEYVDGFNDFAKGYITDFTTKTIAWTGKSTLTSTESYESVVLTKTVYIKTPDTVTSSSSTYISSTTVSSISSVKVSTSTGKTSSPTFSTELSSTIEATSSLSSSKDTTSGVEKSSQSASSSQLLTSNNGTVSPSLIYTVNSNKTFEVSSSVETVHHGAIETSATISMSSMSRKTTIDATSNEFNTTAPLTSHSYQYVSTNYATFIHTALNNTLDNKIIVETVTISNGKAQKFNETATIIDSRLSTLDVQAMTIYKAAYSSDGKIVTVDGTIANNEGTAASSSPSTQGIIQDTLDSIASPMQTDGYQIMTNSVMTLSISSISQLIGISNISTTVILSNISTTVSSGLSSFTTLSSSHSSIYANNTGVSVANVSNTISIMIFSRFIICTFMLLVVV